MAMGALMRSHSLVTTSRVQVAAAHSSGQSTWQRGSTLPGVIYVPPSLRCVMRCTPVVRAMNSPAHKMAAGPSDDTQSSNDAEGPEVPTDDGSGPPPFESSDPPADPPLVGVPPPYESPEIEVKEIKGYGRDSIRHSEVSSALTAMFTPVAGPNFRTFGESSDPLDDPPPAEEPAS